MEWSTAARISAEPAFARLVNHLRTPGAVGPNIRIGGDSADQVWWDPDGTRDKAKSCAASYSHRVCVTHGITAEQMIAHAGLAEAIGGSLTLDLVMLNGTSPAWAVELARAFNNTVGWSRITAVEIGNEPCYFPGLGIRAPNYTIGDFAGEFDSYAAALADVLPARRFIQGGTFGSKSGWTAHQAAFAASRTETLKSWSLHGYATSTCHGATVTMPDLMADAAAAGFGAEISGWSAAVRAVGVPFVVGETNSAGCGGQEGVSDSLAAALWSVDYLAWVAKGNVSRANMHGGGGYYSWLGPFSESGAPDVWPLWYGLHLFAVAVGGGVRAVTLEGAPDPRHCAAGVAAASGTECCADAECGGICGGDGCGIRAGGAALCCDGTIAKTGRVCTSADDVGCVLTDPRPGDLVRAHAFASEEGMVRVLVVNKDFNATKPTAVSVTIPQPDGRPKQVRNASLLVLAGPRGNFSAKHGLSFAGQTWDGSKTGELVGEFTPIPVAPVVVGSGKATYLFDVAPGSAAVLVTSA